MVTIASKTAGSAGVRRTNLARRNAGIESRLARWRGAIISSALFVLCFIAFAPALRAGYINFDDNLYVPNNPLVQAGLTRDGAVQVFTRIDTSIGYWIPLTTVSYMVDRSIFGPGPFGNHFTNVLLHACNAVLFFQVIRYATGDLWRSALAAAVFAVHPLRVESVAWVTERKDVLSGLLGLLALAAYIRYARSGRWGWMGVSCVMLALSLMAKGMMVAFPIVLLLLDIWPLSRLRGTGVSREGWRTAVKLTLEKIPLGIVCIGGAIITVVAQKAGGAVADLAVYSFGDRCANAVVSYVRYLSKAVVPINLAVFYPFFADWSMAAVIGSLVLLTALTAAVVWQRRKRPWLLVGWFWFIIAFVPMIGFVQVGAQSMADRFTYFPMMGMGIALAWSLPSRHAVRWAVASSVLIASYVALSFSQSILWHDSVTLWTSALRSTEDNELARFHLGRAYEECNQTSKAIEELQRAVAYGGDSDSTIPNYLPLPFSASMELGRLYEKTGDRRAAIKQYQRALKLDPTSDRACLSLGLAYAQTGQFELAQIAFNQAIQLNPHNWRPFYNVGLIYLQSGQRAAARQAFQTALTLGVDDKRAEKKLIGHLEELNHAAADAPGPSQN